ncbi:hypothetical protein T05_6640 [Trichinella murrelli]|uniref:Uncharacterized protein n=1 Tax=Trichinella murrelli TaxID=144512 RepID=A0A0V0U972_9BILA|nr:hypothetical protein T05_6640 [Trichinella murrelli]
MHGQIASQETRPLKATIHAASSKLKQKCRCPKHIALVATTRRLKSTTTMQKMQHHHHYYHHKQQQQQQQQRK